MLVQNSLWEQFESDRPFPLRSPIHLQSTHAYFYDSGRNHGHEVTPHKNETERTEASSISEADPPRPLQLSRRSLLSAYWYCMDNSDFASFKKYLVNNFHPPIEHQPAGDESSRVGFTSAEHLARNYAGQRLQAGSVTQL